MTPAGLRRPRATRRSITRQICLASAAALVVVPLVGHVPASGAPVPAAARYQPLQLRVVGGAGANAITPVTAEGQQVLVVDVDATSGRSSAARRWSAVDRSSGSGDRVQVAYGVDEAGTITSRTVLHTSDTVMKSGQRSTQYAISRTGVSLSWWQPSGAKVAFTVAVDGVVRTTTRATAWTDTVSDQSVAHTYTVTGKRQVVANGRASTEPFYYEVTTDPVDDSAVGLRIGDARVSSAAYNTDVAARAYPKATAMLSYRAFIADKRVGTPKKCAEYYMKKYRYYSGDGRGWDSSVVGLPSSRLVGQTSISFYSDSSGEDFYRHVGTTIAYDKNGNEKKRKTASSVGIQLDNRNSGTGSRYEGIMTIAGSNPLCTASPAINGIVRYTVKSNGSFHLVGNHDQAPNHELLYNFFNGKKTVSGCAYHKKIKAFEYLIPSYPNAYYDITFNPITKKKTC